jgi:hypothetical protein
MAMGSIQPLTAMSTTIFFGGKGGWFLELATLTHSSAECFEVWEPQPPENLRFCAEM